MLRTLEKEERRARSVTVPWFTHCFAPDNRIGPIRLLRRTDEGRVDNDVREVVASLGIECAPAGDELEIA
jgi:hypothetical protein